MNHLIQTNELKTNNWYQQEKRQFKPKYRYDSEDDVLIFYFTEKEKSRIITHFLDKNVAFLYRHSDKEIVGMRIDDFERDFLPQTPGQKTWRLSDLDITLAGICDIVFTVEKIPIKTTTQQSVKREIKNLELVCA